MQFGLSAALFQTAYQNYTAGRIDPAEHYVRQALQADPRHADSLHLLGVIAGGKPLEEAQVREAIADAEARLNGSGRLVVRASGTEPLIRIMAEGDDEKVLAQVVKDIAGAVKKAAA